MSVSQISWLRHFAIISRARRWTVEPFCIKAQQASAFMA
jgi:hypothetical protein